MTDKHPTDALPMPEPCKKVHVGVYRSYDITPRETYYTADQLRAERIAAYNLGNRDGRESMREEAAKKCVTLAVEKAAKEAPPADWFDCEKAIRSIEL